MNKVNGYIKKRQNPKTRQNRDNTHENDKKEGYKKNIAQRGNKFTQNVNTYADFVTLTTSCEAPHYSSITQTHINYLVILKKNDQIFFYFSKPLTWNVL
jgi:hypothetical protein